jgi:integrase/recombinase XerD
MGQHELETLGELYLKDKNLSRMTLKAYRGALRSYVTYLRKHQITYATTADIIRYKAYRKSLGHSAAYIYINFSFLKGFYRYLKTNARKLNLPVAYQYDVMAPIKNQSLTHHIHKRILTKEEARYLILKTKDMRHEIWQYRDHAIIILMLTSGIRPFEINHLKRSNYQIHGGEQILYIEVKGIFDKTSFVKVSKGTKKAIDDYLLLRTDDNPYLFISHRCRSKTGMLSRSFFQHMFKRLLKNVAFQDLKITAHVLVHTAAIINLKRGGSLVSTQVLMRHQEISSTKVYEDYLYKMSDQSSEAIDAFILREKMNPDDQKMIDDWLILADIEVYLSGG